VIPDYLPFLPRAQYFLRISSRAWMTNSFSAHELLQPPVLTFQGLKALGLLLFMTYYYSSLLLG
jgi:hypothetical protein